MKKIFLFFLLIIFIGCAKPAMEVPKAQMEPVLSGNEEVSLDEALNKNKKEEKANLEELQGLKKLSPEEISPDMIAKAQHSLNDAVQEKGALAKMIHFDFDSYELNTEAKQILEEVANYLKEYKTLRIVVEGHCDERGTREYNLALGMKRAEVAKKYLSDLGVEDSRIEIISYGEDKPLIVGSGEDVWSKNRRDQFKRIQ
ncbi:MAG: peptidoglycan-associated lipoprotein Pal [bacterium]